MSGAIDRVVGRVHRLGDNVDTDAILPGRYLALREPAVLGAHCLEDLDPGFRSRVREGDILVAGRNFGTGSSREHAVVALKAAGIRAIVAASAARIFFRNAINLGLPVMVSPEAAAGLEAGADAEVSVVNGRITQGTASWIAQPLDGEVAAILACGGLLERTRQILAGPSRATTR
ncbi:MAG TPA: 3-isopropylmalate dehydratase small subunit [Hyphomicrobiales bacterium]|nr:3-isopropylmalate dehydratase small subunit [Hyphomicrobiales bacterium]